MKDPIERQAIINELESWLKVEGYSEGELNIIKAVLYELQSLPSAQQDVTDTNVGDMINRQAAINRAVTITMFGRDIRVVGVSELESLPSVQTEKRTEERTETHACDLISRQTAIDAIAYSIELCNKALDSMTLGGRDRYAVEVERNSLLKLKDDFKYLPSAQPELEDKILAIGYTGKEGRIYIGGRLFAVRELAQ